MHRTDRQQLNDRFVKVYRLLENKGLIVRNHRQKSKSAFARKLGTKGHIIDNYLEEKRHITYPQVKMLCNAYGISEAYMFQGIGKIFQKNNPKSNLNPPKGKGNQAPDDELLQTSSADTFNILFTSTGAFASDTVSLDVGEENQYFHIPGMQGELVAFNINGNSMTPSIANGDMVICSPLDNKSEVCENEIYAVITNEGVRVKRLQRIYDNNGVWTHLKLISDNYIDFDPVVVKLENIRYIYKVIRRLTDLRT
ncbi:MAG: LexA family transcriptional regulator [Bacteroidota bacterium]